MRARLGVRGVLLDGGPALELPPDGPGVPLGGAGLLAGRNAVEAEGQAGGQATGGLCVDGQGVPVDVLEVVAGQVVAGVGGGAGSGEDAGGGDAALQEAVVVAVGGEGLKGGGLAVGGQVVGQVLRAHGAALEEVGVLVDDELGEGGADHVKVGVEADLVGLLLAHLARGSVKVGTDQTGLLSTPPDETELVLEAAVLLDRTHDLEQSRGSGAVVVDTRAGLDRVEMGTENDDTVGVLEKEVTKVSTDAKQKRPGTLRKGSWYILPPWSPR